MLKESITSMDPKYANDSNYLLKNLRNRCFIYNIGSVSLSPFILSVPVAFCSTCDIFQ